MNLSVFTAYPEPTLFNGLILRFKFITPFHFATIAHPNSDAKSLI